MDSTTAQKPALNANATEQQSVTPTADRLSIDDLEDARPATNAQGGVQKIEAVTLTWSKNSVFLLLILIWFLTLVNNMKTSMVYSLTAYATSDFLGHSLLTVISVVASAMAGAVYIPMAKALDLWGRAEGFMLMTLLCIIGIILLAASQNLPTYCAGEVFYSVGFGGLAYSWNVLAADITSLRNRGLAFAFTSSPALISAFAGSKAAAEFLLHSTWRWGYGMWAIVLPAFAFPVIALLMWNTRRAEKNVAGVLLFAGGMVVFLLPFTLATSAPNGWSTGYIIAMIVVGFFLLVAFALYEIKLAPVPFLNYQVLSDRTVLGACLLDMTYQISYGCYASYLPSFLQVVYELDVATAGYVGNTFSVVSFVFLFVAGWLIRWTGRFKWILWICVPLYIFGLGLMIHFRTPGGHIGYVVMCEIFFSISGAIFILCTQLAVLASVDHQHIAAVLAFLFVMGSIGGSIGAAICGAIWTNTFLPALARNLPRSAMADLPVIYSSLVQQLSYPVRTPERDGIVAAYGYAQPILLAAGTAFMALGFIWVGMMRNLNLKTMEQSKGNLF
ncbi:MFS general substrate transporter [Hortaea werneckii]|nr:MFS general substrate transporter [Hortaea werneckii]